MNNSISVRRMGSHELPLPAQMTAGAAGFDLRSTVAYTLQPGERHCFPTGFAWEIPDEFCGQIWPRSGLAVKHGIDTLAGMIDPDYTGEIIVALVNHGAEPFEVKVGDRIAQMVLTLFVRGTLVERQALKETERGDGGFSSTGIA
jgi:dUTP pyrophosphatase